MVPMIFKLTSTVLVVVAGLLFLRLIAATYRTEAPYALKIDRGYSVRSVALAVAWFGTLSLATLWRAVRVLLDTLFEASAELGEWYFRRRGLDGGSQLE